MLTKTYVLFTENEKSLRYMSECMSSLASIDTDIKPVKGIQGVSYIEICDKLGFIPSTSKALENNVLNVQPDGTFCCTVGHYVMWEKIAASGEPGVILEHDAIVKGDYTNLNVEDSEVLFLGPRVYLKDDYTFPGGEYEYIPVRSFEGTHAYALTASTAQSLLDIVRRIPLEHSIDGQLAQRNQFNLTLKTVDPPPVVAAVGERDSFTESTGIPAFYNAIHTPKFLAALKPDAFIPHLKHELLAYKMIKDMANELHVI